ncbi:MAG: transcriptional regulator [Planctomycetia bacterium]|nr:transcriptional regulator [Planctomycetia bacterium]
MTTTSTSTPLKIDRIDPVIHERARLGIMSLLVPAGAMTLMELKRHLGMTDGNLSVHLRALEQAGYVEVSKSFLDRKPRTEAVVTRRGRAAFRAYVEELGKIVKGEAGGGGRRRAKAGEG